MAPPWVNNQKQQERPERAIDHPSINDYTALAGLFIPFF